LLGGEDISTDSAERVYEVYVYLNIDPVVSIG
jgi:hypothetical protein